MKVRLISGKELMDGTLKTVRRFPLVTVFLVMGAIVSLCMEIIKPEGKAEHYFRNMVMVLALMVPVLYSIRLFFESGWIQERVRKIIELGAIVAAGFYFYYLPADTLIPLYISQYVVLSIIAILLCFVCIKQGLKDDEFFWQFTASLVVRLFFTWIYSTVILLGTSAAMAAIDALFKTHLMSHLQAKVMIITAWLITPLFFLSGVPLFTNTEELKQFNRKGLKNFGLYVLVPLTIVYLGILYAYGIKILAQWNLPEGTVSYLVLTFASFGIITLLVIFPFQNDEKSRWSRLLSKSFYFLQLPLLVLLYVAIFTRVFQYGITLRRYYVLALAVWLTLITIYMIIKKGRNIMMIPLSLLMVGVLSLICPWSSFSISYRSQEARLLNMLSSHSLIQGSRLVRRGEDLPSKTKADISSILMYLKDYGKLKKLAYLSASGAAVTPESFTEELGFKFNTRYDNRWSMAYKFNENVIIKAKAYETIVIFNRGVGSSEKITVQGNDVIVDYDREKAAFHFKYGDSHTADIDLKSIVEYFREQPDDSPDKGKYVYKDDRLEITCLFNSLFAYENENKMNFSEVNVLFLIKSN